MPFNSALSAGNLVSLRGNASTAPVYYGATYLSYNPMTNVYTARVNDAITATSFAEFEYDGGSGTLANVKVGMTILLSKSNDKSAAYFKGRIRKAPGATTFYINETSTNIENDDYVFVVEDFAIWDKLGVYSATSVVTPDWDVSFRQLLPLIYNLKSAYADWINSVTSVYQIAFAPLAVAPTSGASISTWAWDVGDGTITVGTSSTQNITATFPAGFRWVHLTVTDDGGRASTRHIPVWAHDPASISNILLNVGDLEVTVDIETGPSASVSAFANVSTLLDGTLVCAWTDENYNGSDGHIVDNIAFVGRIRTEASPTRYDEAGQIEAEARFEIEGPLQQLDRLELTSFEFTNDSTPTAFNEVNDLTPMRAIHLILTEYSTFHELHSVYFDSTDGTYEVLGLSINPDGSILGAVNELASSINAQMQMNYAGQAEIVRDGNIIPTASRGALTTVAAWTTADILDILHDHDQDFTIGWLWASGGSYAPASGLIVAVDSVAPGAAQMHPDQKGTLEGQVLTASATTDSARSELNVRSGHAFAAAQEADRLTITHPDGYWFLIPDRAQWYTFTLDGTETVRGIVLDSTTNWWLESVTTRHVLETGTREVQAVYRKETSGAAGDTVIIDTGWQTSLPSFTLRFPEISFPTLSGVGSLFLNRGVKTIAAFNDDGYIYYTGEWGQPGGPSDWTRVDMSGALTWAIGESFRYMEVDPGSPFNVGSGPEANCWVVTTHSIYYITDVFDKGTGFSVAKQHDFNVNSGGYQVYRTIHAKLATDGYCAVAIYNGNDGTYPGVWVAYTTDRGATWTEVQVSANYSTDGLYAGPPGIYYSHKSRLILVSAYTSTASTPAIDIYKSTDDGATWAQDSTRALWGASRSLALDIHSPIHNNASDLLIYWGFMLGTGQPFLMKSNGNTVTDISPVINGKEYGSIRGGRWTIHSYPYDRLRMIAYVSNYADSVPNVIVTSIDGGTTWTVRDNQAAAAGYYFAGISGNDPDVVYLCGVAGALGYSEDFCATIQDQRGNIVTDFLSIGNFHFLLGG